MPVYGYPAGLVQQVLLVLQRPILPPPKCVEEIRKDAIAHRDRRVPDRKAALEEELAYVLQARVPVDHEQQGQQVYPGGVQGVEELLQPCKHALRCLIGNGVLAVLDNGDLLPGAEVVVRDEADPLLDAADDTSHLETPLAVLALPVGAGIHIVPILDCLHHGAFRLESPDVLGNGISGHKLPPVSYTYRIPNYGTGEWLLARKIRRENRGF